jgi:hypothetical protein
VATVQRYVDTASSAGGNGTTTSTTGGDANRAYATLSEWEANQASTGTDDYIVDCAASGGAADTTFVNVNFATITSGSILIQQSGSNANTGAAVFDTSKYRLSVNGSAFRPNANKITLRRMQIECTSTGNFVSAISLNSGSLQNFVVEYCRIRYAGPSGGVSYNASNPSGSVSGTNVFRNNILQGTGASAGGGIDLQTATTDIATACDVDIYQNTFYLRTSQIGVNIQDWTGAAAQNINIKNNIVANTTNPFNVRADTGSFVAVFDYNWTDDGADGTTNEQNLPAHGSTFTSAGTGTSADFSLLQALATGGQVGSITDDILGDARGTGADCDAGAHEFADAGGYTLAADSGSYSLTGQAAALRATRELDGAAGSYTLTGQDATLTYTPAGGGGAFTLTADPGSYALTGVAAGLKTGRKVAGAAGSYGLSGQAASLRRSRNLVAAAGSYTLTGVAATFRQTYALDADAGAYVITGMNASLEYSNQGIWTPVSAAGGTWTPATPAGGSWTPA